MTTDMIYKKVLQHPEKTSKSFGKGRGRKAEDNGLSIRPCVKGWPVVSSAWVAGADGALSPASQSQTMTDPASGILRL